MSSEMWKPCEVVTCNAVDEQDISVPYMHCLMKDRQLKVAPLCSQQANSYYGNFFRPLLLQDVPYRMATKHIKENEPMIIWQVVDGTSKCCKKSQCQLSITIQVQPHCQVSATILHVICSMIGLLSNSYCYTLAVTSKCYQLIHSVNLNNSPLQNFREKISRGSACQTQRRLYRECDHIETSTATISKTDTFMHSQYEPYAG